MRRALFAVLFFLTLFIVSFILFDPVRELKKTILIKSVHRLNNLDKHEDGFVVEQTYFPNTSLVAAAEKNIYGPQENITLLIYQNNADKLKIKTQSYNPKGALIHETTQVISTENLNNPISYSTTKGVIGTPLSLELASNLQSGWLAIELTNDQGNELNIPVFIESDEPAETLFVESTDTFSAYVAPKAFPTHYRRSMAPLGAYSRPKTNPADYKITIFGKQTPLFCSSHLINADFVHKRNLDKLGIAFKTVSDAYLDDPKHLEGVRTLIFGSHNEYWTKEKANNVLHFVEHGGKALFLGGNSAWRYVIRGDQYTIFSGDNLLDDESFRPFIENVLGTLYSHSGYDTHAPFRNNQKSKRPMHYLKNVTIADRFGIQSDFTQCQSKATGASGHETDKRLPTANPAFINIAKGENGFINQGGADIVYRDFKGGGAVLNFSSVALWHSLSDPTIKSLIQQFLMSENQKAH